MHPLRPRHWERWTHWGAGTTMLFAILFIFIIGALTCLSATRPADSLSGLTPGQERSGFRVVNLYCDENRRIAGVKLEHIRTGAPVFFLQMETVPQVLMWIDTPATSDQGLPHALEHLLAGKGTKGRYSTLLREMRLGWSSAATYQDYNFYSFLSGSGTDAFFEQLHAWLDALYRPDFSDNEAEREFYHFGVVTDPITTKKSLIEKGTVYDEMQPRQGQYGYSFAANQQVLGDRNPFGFNSGGVPSEMRGVTPKAIRTFHEQHYRLGPGTGFVFVFDPKENLTEVLARISREFDLYSSQSGEPRARTPRAPNQPKYAIHSAVSTAAQIYSFPDSDETSPGVALFSWRPIENRDAGDLKMLELLLSGLGKGEQSLLYKTLIDRRTRELDSGATEVSASVSLENSPSFAIPRVEISGIPGTKMSVSLMENLRTIVLQKLKEISEYPDGSDPLLAFNKLIASEARADRRTEVVWSKSPPSFGAAALLSQLEWKEHLQKLELDEQSVRSLPEEGAWQSVAGQLKSRANIWRKVIQQFHLLDEPYATGSAPSGKLLDELEVAKRDRLQRATRDLVERYHAADDQEALSRFENDEKSKSMEIEKIGATVARPSFIEHPPLTPDDSIRYRQFKLAGAPVVASFFKRPPTIDIGLSFDLSQVPRRYYKLLTLMPGCLDSLGLNLSGQVVPYPELRSQIREAAYDFSVKYPVDLRSKKVHLEIRASASDEASFRKTLSLIREMMEETYLDLRNADRLRDIVAENIVSDDRFTQEAETGWLQDPVDALLRERDPLFRAANSHFTKAHWNARLAWLLHKPVPAEEIDNLGRFGENILAGSTGLSPQELSQKLSRMEASGLQAEMLEYWRKNIFSFSQAGLIDGLRQLLMEAQQDLRAGPAETIDDLRQLGKFIFNRHALEIDLTLSEGDLKELQPDLVSFLESIPAGANASDAPAERAHPDFADAMSRVTAMPYPRYVGFVEPGSINGDAVFYSDFPGYAQLDKQSLLTSLASTLLSGAGPSSLYMKTWEAGLAYSNGVASLQDTDLLEYYADRSPDLPALMEFVLSGAKGVSELPEKGIVDYALSQSLSFSREMLSPSVRGRWLARDLRDGITPEKVRHFSEALLVLRRDPELAAELKRIGFDSICGVLPTRDCSAQQAREHTIFFFLGSEKMLAEVEKSLGAAQFIRLYPSDYWMQ